MAHWLKAAEDLFEVVDRRAKLVVGEKDELSNTPAPASNGKGSQTKKSRLKAKAQKKLSSNETQKPNDASSTQNNTETEKSDVAPEKEVATSILETGETNPSISSTQTNSEEQNNVEKEGSLIGAPLPESLLKENTIDDNSILLPNASTSNEEIISKNSTSAFEEISLPRAGKGVEVVQEHAMPESGHNIGAINIDSPINSEEEKVLKHVHVGEHSKVNMQPKDAKIKVEPLAVENIQEKKTDSTLAEVQDQLDEAQGLLKSAISTGQSKEARLARVCAGLSSRLQEYKSESAQLEELLTAERELSKSYEAQIKQLQKDLSESRKEATRVELSISEALAAKNSEIEALVISLDAVKKQAALAEGNLASVQANMESIMRNRELTETRMMQALREELSSVERRAEEERAAHNATKMAAMEREVELEHCALEASTALARIQRTADERMAKAAELEQKTALLEIECASLNQELQDMEARTRRGQKKPPEEANQMIQAWQEEAEKARQLQRDAESKLSSSEAEVQKLRVEMAAMKRDAEHYSRQEHTELEKRYRELTDLLYYKQTQLEVMASEKAAAEFQLEKEMRRLQETQVEAERSRVSRRPSSSWEEDSDMKALEPLPLHHRHMAAASIQLQKAAKLLDTGAVRATRFLWRYPTARISLLCYLVFVHLFLMYLLHRLQEQADSLSSRELAESMGLANHTLP